MRSYHSPGDPNNIEPRASNLCGVAGTRSIRIARMYGQLSLAVASWHTQKVELVCGKYHPELRAKRTQPVFAKIGDLRNRDSAIIG